MQQVLLLCNVCMQIALRRIENEAFLLCILYKSGSYPINGIKIRIESFCQHFIFKQLSGFCCSVAYSKFYYARRRQTNVLRFPVGHEYNNYNYLHYLAYLHYLHYLQISTQTRGIELPWHKILRIIPQPASH